MATATKEVKGAGRRSRVRRPVAVLPGPGRAVDGGRTAHARYDLVQDNRDHDRRFSGADALDAVMANTAAVRAKARSRARKVVQNGCHARGMLETVANDTVGAGPQLQMLTNDEALNTEIEGRFGEWADAVDLAAHLRTMRKARIQDGEAFLMPIDNPDLMLDGIEKSRVQLDLRAIECDQVETPPMPKEGAKYVEGIRFNERGVPMGYALLKTHPGGLMPTGGYDEVPREKMIHWFRVDRPGQIRGYPEIGPAVMLYEQLRCYTLAVLTSAEMTACFTLMLETQAGMVEGAAQLQTSEGGGSAALSAYDIERGMLTVLPEGHSAKQIEPTQPPVTYEMFVKVLLMEIARVLSIPYCVAAGSSQGLNYASGRLDFKAYFKMLRVEQAHCEQKVLNRIFAMWFREAELIWPHWAARLQSAGLEGPRPRHEWMWTRDEHVDPLKEAGAQAQRLRSCTTTLSAECSAFGRDWRDVVKQRGVELAMMRELGIPIDEGKGGADGAPTGDQDGPGGGDTE